MELPKNEIARRQLGTALWLWLSELDHVSVHCLAAGGREVAEGTARLAGKDQFAESASEGFYEQAKLYGNAMKHAMDRQADEQNDGLLFVGWHDYALAIETMPVEAQVSQVWYMAAPGVLDDRLSKGLFPATKSLPRNQQKQQVLDACKGPAKDRSLLLNPATDQRPLMLREIDLAEETSSPSA